VPNPAAFVANGFRLAARLRLGNGSGVASDLGGGYPAGDAVLADAEGDGDVFDVDAVCVEG